MFVKKNEKKYFIGSTVFIHTMFTVRKMLDWKSETLIYFHFDFSTWCHLDSTISIKVILLSHIYMNKNIFLSNGFLFLHSGDFKEYFSLDLKSRPNYVAFGNI